MEKGQLRLHDEVNYRFHLTNDRVPTPRPLVFKANDRCDQENLIAQLKGGVHALTCGGGQPGEQLGLHGDDGAGVEPEGVARAVGSGAPSSQGGSSAQKRGLLRMEFKRFVNTVILMPCQIVRGGRRLIYRLLSWNEWQGVLLRVVHSLRC